jgi:alpha-N-arabinofuranosidase
MHEFDVVSLKVVGKEQMLVNGGTDISKKPVWIEAPHIFKVGGYYYLIAAEGGTADNHSEVVFRSRKVGGPYVSYEKNPILTQRHLDPKRDFPITCTGHADFVQTKAGNWWAVFLGCRPYRPFEGGYYNTGRETFLAPVRWRKGWPLIDPDHQQVQYHYPFPLRPSQAGDVPHGGNFVIRDEFSSDNLGHHWMFLRTPKEKWYSLSDRKGFLGIRLRPETCAERANPSFIGHRQQHLVGLASVSLDFSPRRENEKAGLLVFQNERRFYFLCRSLAGKEPVVQLYKSADSEQAGRQMQLMASLVIRDDPGSSGLFLRIEAQGNVYSFLYAVKPGDWKPVKENVDARYLSTKEAGGFVGCVYALYATSLGQTSSSTAYFDWFEYSGNDEVYR